MPVYVFATLDTKGHEAAFVREELVRHGVPALLVDTGCLGEPQVVADLPREEFYGEPLAALRAANDRGAAVAAAAQAAAKLAATAHAAGTLMGVLSLGGSAGSTIGSAAMQALPIGVPKVMVSTLASGQTRPYVGCKDIFMLNAVVDIAGLNRISRVILSQAAAAMAGLVQHPPNLSNTVDRPLIAATMFGVTTPCVDEARKILTNAGYEVLVFHATGSGGQAMEELIESGLMAGVLDITTTELADELVGGVLSAGPHRLTAASRRGVPQVISVGALDMVNFGPRDSVPAMFAQRQFYQHNATITLMRTTPAENRQLGEEIGRKAAAATGPVEILFPSQGVSAIDAPGKPFCDPAARQELLAGLQATHGNVPLLVLDEHINDASFAQQAASRLLALIAAQSSQ